MAIAVDCGMNFVMISVLVVVMKCVLVVVDVTPGTVIDIVLGGEFVVTWGEPPLPEPEAPVG